LNVTEVDVPMLPDADVVSEGDKTSQAGLWKKSILKRVLVVGPQISIIFAICGWYLWQNQAISDEWWLLHIRDVDDLAMNQSVRLIQEAAFAGDWFRVLSFFDYAYGNGFWIFLAILTLPAYLLDLPWLQMIIGRDASLLASLTTSILVALIGRRLFPQGRHLTYAAITLGMITPMVAINATKMHVNSWSTLLGILAIYILTRQDKLSTKSIFFSSLTIGAAVGFKLTALVLVPLFFILLHSRASSSKLAYRGLSSVTFITSALFFTAPLILVAPIESTWAQSVWRTFNLFRTMGTDTGTVTLGGVIEGLSFFWAVWLWFFLLGILGYLSIAKPTTKHERTQRLMSQSVLFTLLFTWIIGSVWLAKAPIYLATYSVAITCLVPLGMFGLSRLKMLSITIQVLLAYGLILLAVISNTKFWEITTGDLHFQSVAYGREMDTLKRAGSEISSIVELPMGETVRVLVEHDAIFPYSNFDEGVLVQLAYGDMRSSINLGDLGKATDYDYAVINSTNYHAMPNQEEDLFRTQLRISASTPSSGVILIYDRYNIEVYQFHNQ
jgi:hypothetical protein